MSFNVNWNTLETDSLRSWTTELLTDALNSGKRPHILASDILIKDLNFGKTAPDFEILEIGELDKDRFRGIFKIEYSGDFHLTLHTKVQANPLKIHKDNSVEKEISPDSSFVTPNFLLSVDAFNLPLDLKLSDIKISGIGIIVFSQSKGLTLVFRNDPLDSIKVSSTFDTVQVLANFLQKQIETQIRDLFRETLPTLIHRLSLKYVSSMNPTDVMTNLKDHLAPSGGITNLDLAEAQTIAPKNLSKLASLYSSRETLDLRVPKLKRIVQRNNLEKFNRHLFPNLVKSLYSNLNLDSSSYASRNSNSVPVELFVENDFQRVDNILSEISSIQNKTYKSTNNNEKRAPRRRTIKLGGSSKSGHHKQAKIQQPPRRSSDELVGSSTINGSSDTCDDTMSSDSTFVLEHESPTKVQQPVPVAYTEKRPPLAAAYGSQYSHIASSHFKSCPSPLSSNPSFIGSVGIGNSSLQLSSAPVSTSPLRRDSTEDAQTKAKQLKIKKSLNHIDISQINEKLQQQLRVRGGLDSLQGLVYDYSKNGETESELPPPPYHVH